jgi:hypothetical protein
VEVEIHLLLEADVQALISNISTLIPECHIPQHYPDTQYTENTMQHTHTANQENYPSTSPFARDDEEDSV